MPLELAAVAFDGAFTAERELNNLRVSRLDPWVGEVAVLEHHDGGLYSTRSTSPDYGGDGFAAPGFSGLPGLLIAAVVGAIPRLGTRQSTGAFGVVADLVRLMLPADTSALLLIAESPAAEAFVSAVAPRGGQVGRRELSDEQVEQLRLAVTRRWLPYVEAGGGAADDHALDLGGALEDREVVGCGDCRPAHMFEIRQLSRRRADDR